MERLGRCGLGSSPSILTMEDKMKFLDDERNVFVTAEDFESLERQAIKEFSWIVGVFPGEEVTLIPFGMEYVVRVKNKDGDIRQAKLLWLRY